MVNRESEKILSRTLIFKQVPMPPKWTPQDLVSIIIATSACLCLLILVLGVVLLAFVGKLSPEVLGSIKGAGVGGGLLGLAYILFLTVKISMRGGKTNTNVHGDQ